MNVLQNVAVAGVLASSMAVSGCVGVTTYSETIDKPGHSKQVTSSAIGLGVGTVHPSSGQHSAPPVRRGMPRPVYAQQAYVAPHAQVVPVQRIRVVQSGGPQIVYHSNDRVLEVQSGTLCSATTRTGFCIYAPQTRGGVQVHRFVYLDHVAPQYHVHLQRRMIPAAQYRHEYHSVHGLVVEPRSYHRPEPRHGGWIPNTWNPQPVPGPYYR